MYLLLALEDRSVRSIVVKLCLKASGSQLRAILRSGDNFVCHTGTYDWCVVRRSRGVAEHTVMKGDPLQELSRGHLGHRRVAGQGISRPSLRFPSRFDGRFPSKETKALGHQQGVYLGFGEYSHSGLWTWLKQCVAH